VRHSELRFASCKRRDLGMPVVQDDESGSKQWVWKMSATVTMILLRLALTVVKLPKLGVMVSEDAERLAARMMWIEKKE